MMSSDSGDSSILVLLDLSAAFDTVDHHILVDRLNKWVGITGSALDWFHSYLTDRSFSVAVGPYSSESTTLTCGVPQGSVLGPLLFALYMLPLKTIINTYEGISYHCYADDIQLYCSFKPDNMDIMITKLHDCISAIKNWMAANFLQLNPDKTEVLIIAQSKIAADITDRLGSLKQNICSNPRNLGVILDQSLLLDKHIHSLSRTCFYHLRNITKLRSVVSHQELETIIHAFVSSRLDYCNSLFTCLSKTSLDRLQLVQNTAARILTRSRRSCHITPVLASLHWLPVQYRIRFKILVITHRALHGQAPNYLSDLLTPYVPIRSLRSSSQALLVVPQTKLITKGDRAFACFAPRVWNELPFHLRTVDSVDIFKRLLKTHLFRKAFPQLEWLIVVCWLLTPYCLFYLLSYFIRNIGSWIVFIDHNWLVLFCSC